MSKSKGRTGQAGVEAAWGRGGGRLRGPAPPGRGGGSFIARCGAHRRSGAERRGPFFAGSGGCGEPREGGSVRVGASGPGAGCAVCRRDAARGVRRRGWGAAKQSEARRVTGDAPPPPRRLRARPDLGAAVARRERSGSSAGRARPPPRRYGQRGGVRADLPAPPARLPLCRYVPRGA